MEKSCWASLSPAVMTFCFTARHANLSPSQRTRHPFNIYGDIASAFFLLHTCGGFFSLIAEYFTRIQIPKLWKSRNPRPPRLQFTMQLSEKNKPEFDTMKVRSWQIDSGCVCVSASPSHQRPPKCISKWEHEGLSSVPVRPLPMGYNHSAGINRWQQTLIGRHYGNICCRRRCEETMGGMSETAFPFCEVTGSWASLLTRLNSITAA